MRRRKTSIVPRSEDINLRYFVGNKSKEEASALLQDKEPGDEVTK